MSLSNEKKTKTEIYTFNYKTQKNTHLINIVFENDIFLHVIFDEAFAGKLNNKVIKGKEIWVIYKTIAEKIIEIEERKKQNEDLT